MTDVNKLKKDLKSKGKARSVRERLAEEIVTMYHGSKKANKAKDNYNRNKLIKVAERINVSEGVSVVIKERARVEADYALSWPEKPVTFNGFLGLLVKGKLVSSKSDARRKISEGALSVNGKIVKIKDNFLYSVKKGDLIRLGKRFLRIK